jgi:Flp pilus assembly pilin Flp
MVTRQHFRLLLQSLAELVRDDNAQDLVEYALLAAFIATAGYVVLAGIAPTLGATYTTWLDPSNGVPSLWDPPAPLGSGS